MHLTIRETAMFNQDKLYLANDPALLVIGPYSTLAHWRCEGRGPAYIRVGARIAYSGADLNAWLAQRRVPTADQPAPAAA